METVDIAILSTDHGRDRRLLRGIEKVDLQTAVKYGKAEQSQFGRWKFTYGDIVFITDPTKKIEITSWRLPNTDLERAQVVEGEEGDHEAVKNILLTDHTKCTSHTVVVVDQSGSMRNCDVDGWMTRSDAVFAALATDFVAAQLRSQFSANSEVMSVLTMQCTGQARLVREPITWVLYNKLLDLKRYSHPGYHGNFLPALEEAKRLLSEGIHPNLALHLVFLSDGKPSDQGICHTFLPYTISSFVAEIAKMYRDQITMKFIGFGLNAAEFTVLPKMCRAVEAVGVKAEYVHSRLQTASLSEAMRSSTASISQSISDIAGRAGATKGFIKEGPEICPHALASPLPSFWNVFHNSTQLLWSGDKGEFEKGSDTQGIAVCKQALGSGLERIVYRLRNLGRDGASFVGPSLVAKESNLVVGSNNYNCGEGCEFHKTFCATQLTARHLATEFNRAIHLLANFNPALTPLIVFLDCSVFTVDIADDERGIEKQAFLVEKMLDVKHYRKWNDNAGGVDGNVLRRGVELHPKPDSKPIMAKPAMLEAVLEGSDDDEESDDDDDDNDDDDIGSELDIDMAHLTIDGSSQPAPLILREASETCGYSGPKNIRLSDFPQAFSHFTYRYSKGKLLVCDLQGVYDEEARLFELTDPVIHYKSSQGRRNVYGRTDRGRGGISDFLRTHTCNELCRMLPHHATKKNPLPKQAKRGKKDKRGRKKG